MPPSSDPLSRELADTLEGLRRIIDAKAPSAPETIEPDAQAGPGVQLPLWPESRRAAPNVIFRSALFPATNFQNGRPFVKNQLLASVGGTTVYFTGERFDQSDLDVYLEILNFARQHPLGTECTFSAYSLLKALGRSTGYSDHKWLHSVLIRLRGGTLDITDRKKRYFGGLIGPGIKDEITRYYRVAINTEFAKLFGFGMWSSIDRDQRRRIGRNMTAKALHAYYSTHAACSAHSFEKLAALVGLNNPNKRQQRATLIRAHMLLASEQICFLRSYTVSPDRRTITVALTPTRSQARHLGRKAFIARGRRSRDGVDGRRTG